MKEIIPWDIDNTENDPKSGDVLDAQNLSRRQLFIIPRSLVFSKDQNGKQFKKADEKIEVLDFHIVDYLIERRSFVQLLMQIPSVVTWIRAFAGQKFMQVLESPKIPPLLFTNEDKLIWFLTWWNKIFKKLLSAKYAWDLALLFEQYNNHLWDKDITDTSWYYHSFLHKQITDYIKNEKMIVILQLIRWDQMNQGEKEKNLG